MFNVCLPFDCIGFFVVVYIIQYSIILCSRTGIWKALECHLCSRHIRMVREIIEFILDTVGAYKNH